MDREKMLIEEVKVTQDIIKRMASNSFNVKAWAITLIVVSLLYRGEGNYIFVSFIPLFAFWYLDSYYLQQEKLFREVHKWIVKYRLSNDDNLFSMDMTRFKNNIDSIFEIMFSKSILPFYGAIFFVLSIYWFFENCIS